MSIARISLFAMPAFAAAAFVGAADAKTVTYDLDSVEVNALSSDPGLVIEHDVRPLPSPFDLEDCESYTFKLFDIWTDENSVEGADKNVSPISVTLNFATPFSSGTVNGTTQGVSTGLFGSIQYGKVIWSGPVTVVLDDVVYMICLSNEIFNKGIFWGTNEGECYGATVYATIKQVSSSTNVVPTPAAAGAGLAMLAAGLFRRRNHA